MSNKVSNQQQKVYVMMSGGVDSSVAALDLKEQGYDVIGVFMKCWSIERLRELGVDDALYGCYWEEDSNDAQLVAHTLGIPFFVWDFEAEYKRAVVDYMIEEYKSGRTPNPDVMCNSMIKFGIFFDRAMQLGADYVATGHYARIREFRVRGDASEISDESKHNKEDLRYSNTIHSDNSRLYIARGKDMNKDQSYFLNRVAANRVDKILFPVGEYESKAEVRARALAYSLITADKKDSQGLCFIGETPLRELLLQTLGEVEGDIMSLDGHVLGRHPGAVLYTIGQRNKLGLAGGPWYVHHIDVKENRVYVAHETQSKELLGSEILATDCNYYCTPQELAYLSKTHQLTGQIRYRQDAEPLHIVNIEQMYSIGNSGNDNDGFDVAVEDHDSIPQSLDTMHIRFDRPIKAISAGQSVVIYADTIMVASGIIT